MLAKISAFCLILSSRQRKDSHTNEQNEATTNSQTEESKSSERWEPAPESKIARLRSELRENHDDIDETIVKSSLDPGT